MNNTFASIGYSGQSSDVTHITNRYTILTNCTYNTSTGTYYYLPVGSSSEISSGILNRSDIPNFCNDDKIKKTDKMLPEELFEFD